MKNKKLLKLLAALTMSSAALVGCFAVGCKDNNDKNKPDEPAHTHTFKDEWKSDDPSGHWHEATCEHKDEKGDFAVHYDNNNDNYCDACGYKMKEEGSKVTVSEITVSGKSVYLQGATFNKSDLVVMAKLSDGTEKNVTADATISTPDLTKLKDQSITVEYGGKSATHAIKVYYAPATEAAGPDFTTGWTAISTVEEFNAFRALESSSGNFYLTADIDLTDVELEATKVMFTGKFDGNGHTIMNASYVKNAANKTGILVRQLNNGASVNNVRFQNCTSSIVAETIGLIAGMSTGEVSISKVEFNGCTVKCNNYSGLCIGRTNSNDSKVTLKEITAKNGVSATVSSYGGTLIGDNNAGTTDKRTELNIIDCDLDIELKGANGNGGFLSGRIRNNTNLNIKNVVLRNAICPAATGLVCGGGSNNAANSTVTVENLYIISTNAELLQSCAVKDATNPVTTFEITYTNSYISCSAPSDTGSYLTEISNDDTDVFWMNDTLKLDFTKEWTTEEKNPSMYRLTASTTNAKSVDASISELKLATASAQVRFEKGTEFNSDGLAVTGIYSDGVNLLLINDEGYTVDSSAFKKDVAGKYTIKVKSKEDENVVAEYVVEVVEQTKFTVDTQFAKLAYVLGEKLDLSKILVYASWTDGKSIATTKYTTNAEELDMTTPGAKDLVISMTGFEAQHVTISVIDTKPYVVDGKVYINVKGDANITYSGEKVDGVETFKTINEAVDYLVAAKLDEQVVKVMYIADGTYTEKITIPAALKNLKIIGQSRDNTKLEYDAVEDSVNPFTGNKYTMDCATLHVNAEGFGLENITVNNTFDYKNNYTMYANPQGFALTINADGAVINNVTLYGNQDTLFFKKGRVYLNNSKISGNIDFIFGENDGLAFFENCTIEAVNKSNSQESNNGYVTAMKGDKDNHPDYGYIFNNCTFTDDGTLKEGSMSLGRPWGPGATVAMINCTFSAAYSKGAFGEVSKPRWYDMSGNDPQNAYFREYGSKGPGALIYTDKDEEANPEHVAGTAYEVNGMKQLTEEQAANYTAANLFAKKNGGVSWGADFDYAGELAKLESYAAKVPGTEIIVKNGETEVGESLDVAAGDVTQLDIYMKEWNASNKNIVPTFEDETVAIWANGGIKGLKEGTTKLTLTCGDIVKELTIQVSVATPFEVTFVTNGGSEVAAQQVYKDRKIAAVTTTKENAVFKGWFTDEKFTTPFDPDKDVIVAATTLYARFVDYADLAKENVTYSFNTTEGDNVNSFQYDGNNQGKTQEAPASFYGLSIWGAKLTERWKTSEGASNDTQINNDTYVSFAVEKFATVVVTYRSKTNATLGIGEDVATLTDGLELTYLANEAGLVVLHQTKNGYITGITVTYPTVIDKTTKIDFGSEGNYEGFKGLDQSKATYGQIQTACNQIITGSVLEFYVNPNATIHISGNWSVGYKINGVEVKTSNAGGTDDTDLNYDYFCEKGGKITIESIHNNNYFYSISISYPFMISENTKITFGNNGNASGTIEGVKVGCTNSPNGDNDSQLKQGNITLNVKAGATIHISGNWCVDYTINGTVVQAVNAGGASDDVLEYDYQVAQDGEVVIVVDPDSKGKNYFYYIEVRF